MPKTCRPGTKINGYTIVDQINNGAMAISYAARSASGEKVFFKQYKSPSVSVAWYKGYVQYQQELKQRIESSRVRNYSYRMIEFFEADWGCKTFFQAFEFVSGGLDMEKVLEKIRARSSIFNWEQRLILAKVMMSGIDALHEAKVVHCDLKPPNIQLFSDSSIKAGYQLKLIDMDFSTLADRQAPWHGHNNYVGTPHYFSPEHLSGQVPSAASDIFTCGLILHELLGSGHPYRTEDDTEYLNAVKSHKAPPVKLGGPVSVPASAEQIAEYLHRALSPRASDRPTAKEINLVLNGRASSAPVSKPVSTPVPSVSTRSAPTAPPAPPSSSRPITITVPRKSETSPTTYTGVAIVSASGRSVQIRIRTDFGKSLCQQFGPDAVYFDSHQFTLDRETDGSWLVYPNKAAKNETLLNGTALAGPVPITSGDVLAVGNSSKGISKLPLTLNIV